MRSSSALIVLVIASVAWLLLRGFDVWSLGAPESAPAGAGADKARSPRAGNLVEVAALGESPLPAMRPLEIVDQDGSPVVNYSVHVWNDIGSLVMGVSDHGGPAIPADASYLGVQAPGFLASLSRLLVGVTPVRVVLLRSRELRVSIVPDDGGSLEGVIVRVRSAQEAENVACRDDSAKMWCEAPPALKKAMLAEIDGKPRGDSLLTVRTDANGHCSCWITAPKVIVEIADRRTLSSKQVEFVRLGTWVRSAPLEVGPTGLGVVVQMQRGAVIRGRIAGEGEPVIGHVVLLHSGQAQQGITVQDVEQEASVSPDGRFEFVDVIPGAKTIVGVNQSNGSVLLSSATLVVEVGRVYDMGVLPSGYGGADIKAEVIDAMSGLAVPIPGPVWEISLSTCQEPIFAHGVRRVAMDSSPFRIRGLPPGLVVIRAELAPGALPEALMVIGSGTVRHEYTVRAAEEIRLQISASRLVPTTIRVDGLAGESSIAGEIVDIETNSPLKVSIQASGQSASTTVSLPEAPRRCRLSFYSDAGATGALVSGQATIVGGKDVHMVLVPAAATRLVVRHASGQPRACSLSLLGDDRFRQVVVAQDGAAVVKGLTPGGRYVLKVYETGPDFVPRRHRIVGYEAGSGSVMSLDEDGSGAFVAGGPGVVTDLGVIVVGAP